MDLFTPNKAKIDSLYKAGRIEWAQERAIIIGTDNEL